MQKIERTKTIAIPCSVKERDAIAKAAQLEGLTMAAWARMKLLQIVSKGEPKSD